MQINIHYPEPVNNFIADVRPEMPVLCTDFIDDDKSGFTLYFNHLEGIDRMIEHLKKGRLELAKKLKQEA